MKAKRDDWRMEKTHGRGNEERTKAKVVAVEVTNRELSYCTCRSDPLPSLHDFVHDGVLCALPAAARIASAGGTECRGRQYAL
jgi:hypothetical protein